MYILLSNDDGIQAPGLRAMYRVLLEAGHRVSVVAPHTEQSAMSCSLNIRTPLRTHVFHGSDFSGTAVEGTPVDCVKFALTTLLEERPDLIISGLNAGCNMGVDIYYSGTVGAALEGAMQGIPSIAFSRLVPECEPPEVCARHAVGLLDALDWASLPAGHMLNINYPHRKIADLTGVRCCRMSSTPWPGKYERHEDPMGRSYWWLSGYHKRDAGGEDTDISVLRSGAVAVVPLCLDRTDYGWLAKARGCNLE